MSRMRPKSRFILIGLLVFLLVETASLSARSSLDRLKPDQTIHGFRLLNLYDGVTSEAVGARFISDKYGFLVDLLTIQSVPQGFFWIKTPPKSDKGEAHTCEHLLLGKGNRGRYVAAFENMSLGSSSAFTAQVRTCYHFNTIAGPETFYQTLEAKLMALLHPDFSDEEIRREVCHIGVSMDPASGQLSLEEKGTVYTEMVSSFEKPWYYAYGAMLHLIYGEDHPLSNVSGGRPSALRTLSPEDLWAFHEETHHLANMGLIVSIPDDISVDSFLERLSQILSKCQETPTTSDFVGISEYPLPEPRPAHNGTVKLVTFPSERKHDPGAMDFCWPAQLEMNLGQSFLLDLFLSALSGGPTSTLYDLFVNSETRQIDIGATGVSSWAPEYQGRPIWISIDGVEGSSINKQEIENVRTGIITEIERIYAFADGSKELSIFNREVESLLSGMRKGLEDLLDSPPMFGYRGGPAGRWVEVFETLEEEEGFRKSLVREAQMLRVEKLLESDANFWRELIDHCELLTTLPHAVGSSPDPAMLEEMRDAKEARIAEHIAEIKAEFGTDDEREALRLYKEAFDLKTAELESIAGEQKLPGFVNDPPLTLDEQLVYETIMLPGNLPLVASTFDNIKSMSVGIALSLDVIPESLLVYVPFLPSVLTSIGIEEDGEAVPFKEMQERLRREVVRFSARFDFGFETGRIELVLAGTGGDIEEGKNVLRWMSSSLYHPYLSVANLPRITDLLDQSISALRNRMKGSEEGWVSDPARANRFQTDPLMLSTGSFLTRTHHLHRLHLMFIDPGNKTEQAELSEFLRTLAEQGKERNRDQLFALLDSFENEDREETSHSVSNHKTRKSKLTELYSSNTKQVIKALRMSLPDIPDANLHEDWAYLCREIEDDLLLSPELTLRQMSYVLELLLKTDNARMFLISSSKNRQATAGHIERFVSLLNSTDRSEKQEYGDSERINERLRSREPGIRSPLYVGLINEGSRNGVIINSARYASSYDTTSAGTLDCLAGKLFMGGGAHGLFMKTWSAGLAYSNGFSANERTGRTSYYAERCPDVAETIRFVVKELRSSELDPSVVDYTVAQVFGGSRAAARFEARGGGIAADLADGYTPELVAAFRSKILNRRQKEDLFQMLLDRVESIYGSVLPGFGAPLSESIDGNFFLIGPEEQFDFFETYLEGTEGPQRVYRLYPRDFWLVRQFD